MPPAILAIQDATRLSAEAAAGLSGEEQTATDKKKLLDGSSGNYCNYNVVIIKEVHVYIHSLFRTPCIGTSPSVLIKDGGVLLSKVHVVLYTKAAYESVLIINVSEGPN